MKINPRDVGALWNLGAISFQRGNVSAALAAWREAVRIDPNRVQNLNRLAWVLATAPAGRGRNGAEAVELAERAAQLAGGRQASVLRTLAAAYAAAGRYPDAVKAAGDALALPSAPRRPLNDRRSNRKSSCIVRRRRYGSRGREKYRQRPNE